MLLLISTVFVTGQAEVFFSKKIRPRVSTFEAAIVALESHFLDERARRVNDEVWNELTFNFIKKKR